MKLSDLFDKAADIIEPEGAWTRDTNARNRYGNRVRYDSPEAVCFCGQGALLRVGGHAGDLLRAYEAHDFFIMKFGQATFNINDNLLTTQADMVRLFRECAEEARIQGK